MYYTCKSIKLVSLSVIAAAEELYINWALIRLTSVSEPWDGFARDPFGQSDGQSNLFCPVNMKTGSTFISAVHQSHFWWFSPECLLSLPVDSLPWLYNCRHRHLWRFVCVMNTSHHPLWSSYSARFSSKSASILKPVNLCEKYKIKVHQQVVWTIYLCFCYA